MISHPPPPGRTKKRPAQEAARPSPARRARESWRWIVSYVSSNNRLAGEALERAELARASLDGETLTVFLASDPGDFSVAHDTLGPFLVDMAERACQELLARDLDVRFRAPKRPAINVAYRAGA